MLPQSPRWQCRRQKESDRFLVVRQDFPLRYEGSAPAFTAWGCGRKYRELNDTLYSTADEAKFFDCSADQSFAAAKRDRAVFKFPTEHTINGVLNLPKDHAPPDFEAFDWLVELHILHQAPASA